MITILDIKDAISVSTMAVNSIKNAANGKHAPYKNSTSKQLSASLREIYFHEEGILAILKKISSGEKLHDIDLNILVEFNQNEPIISRLISDLNRDFRFENEISIKQSSKSKAISYGKLSIRSALMEALNYNLTFGKDINLGEINDLIKEIRNLNSAIEELEESFRI